MLFKFFSELLFVHVCYKLIFTSTLTCASNITNDVHNNTAPSNPITRKDLWGIRSKIGEGEYKFIIVKKLMHWKEAQDACKMLCTDLANFPSLVVIQGVAEALFKLSVRSDTEKNVYPFNDFNSSMNTWDLERQYWIGPNNLQVEEIPQSSSERPLINSDQSENQTDANGVGVPEQKVNVKQCATFRNPTLYNYTDASRHMVKNENCINMYYGICAPRRGIPTDSKRTETKKPGKQHSAENCGPPVASLNLDFHYHAVN